VGVVVAVPGNIGYPLLAGLILGESAGLPLPGETALIAAGGLAAAGHLALPFVILVAAAAAVTGDTLGYLLGRRRGRAFLMRGGFMAAHRRHAIERADWFFERYGTATVFFGRWIPGLRVVAALTAGAARMPWRRFALANATGALAWAATVSTLAMLVGPAGSAFLALGGLGLGAVTGAVAWWHQRRRRQGGGDTQTSPPPSSRLAAATDPP
jgi:undecaprenyl-diphosphatase